MSSEGLRNRRCVVKKLDFENCIVTNIRTKSRGRRKLRARITREVADHSELEEADQTFGKPSGGSPVPGRGTVSPRERSPVLIRRRHKEREPPGFCKRQKIWPSAEEDEQVPEDSTVEEARSPSSPVFKLAKRGKILNEASSRRRESGKASGKEDSSGAGGVESYQIEEATTQESKDSIRISSMESGCTKDSSSSVFSIDSEAAALGSNAGEIAGNRSSVGETCERQRTGKRKYKKNSLLGRLHKLQQKQASEKLLWQHQNRGNSSSCLRFSVVSFWKDELRFFLKCRSGPADPSVTFLVVDSRWVPQLKSVRESSVLRLHPPWQKLTVEESGATVLVNVICLDVLEETEETIAEERTFETVPARQFETLEKLFVDSLFSANSCGFLC